MCVAREGVAHECLVFAWLLPSRRGFLTSAGPKVPWGSISSGADEARVLAEVLSGVPDHPDRIEAYRLRHLATFYSMDAERVNR